MTNSIRTPRQGKSASSRRIAQAVDNEEWQEFRQELKGCHTNFKLYKLTMYFTGWQGPEHSHTADDSDCDVCIRVNNYLKALARGGQIAAEADGNYIDRMLRKQLTVRK